MFSTGYSSNSNQFSIENINNISFGDEASQINDSDEEFLDKIATIILESDSCIVFGDTMYKKNTLSDKLSPEEQKRLTKIVETNPKMVFRSPIICNFLLQYDQENESSHEIQSLLYKCSQDMQCVLYCTLHKLRNIREIEKDKNKLAEIRHMIYKIEKVLQEEEE